ncbi:MAG: circularly permuted type 2 ATP-grasp protein, partial [Janthinobacterium lividum]
MHPLLTHYPAAERRYDEMFEVGATPRPHWKALLAQLEREPADEMRRRVEAIERQVRESGVTYNIYADPEGEQRTWDLSGLPFILPASEWAGIEEAVKQRATLLNKILRDVYGAQKMLHEGLLPAALIHGNGSFLRACHGLRQPNDVALHFYAVDLARAPNGRWWVQSDRTQAPSGAGYALENRSVMSRAFPELYRDMKIQHLANFFVTLRNSLTNWGRDFASRHGESGEHGPGLRDGEHPLIVLLTPGPYNETYYEQTYLARHLGFPLVEGGDLTVRNGMVWLKTVAGPQRVHVILRRVDDDFCDPLELRSESRLGVAGLTDAVRRGNVLVANSLGSSLLESGALLGYLPKLCRRLLDEPLKMPSVATWWCGEPAALKEVIGRIDQLVIKPAFPQLRSAPVFGQDLDQQERAALISAMRAEPQNYVAQEMVRVSQAPVWRKGDAAGLDASAVSLRVFACATPNGYVVMPGGLTRVATGFDARVTSMQQGGASQDTWVQQNGRASAAVPLLRATDSQSLVRTDTHLSSRSVENLFWFGRYAERCDNVTRLMRAALEILLNITPEYRGGEWPTVQGLCHWFGLIENENDDDVEASADPIMTDTQFGAALMHAVAAPSGPGLARHLQQLFNVAGHLRERLSMDNWHTLNHVVQRHARLGEHPTLADAMATLNETAASLMALSGFAL